MKSDERRKILKTIRLLQKDFPDLSKNLLNLHGVDFSEEVKSKLDRKIDKNVKIDQKIRKRIKKLIDEKEVILIPCGFRCHTKSALELNLDIKQASLPFDSGFFSMESICNILRNEVVSLSFDNHMVCKKEEKFKHPSYGKVLKFTPSSYDEIDSIIENCEKSEFNKYLDTTYGYYTWDRDNDFVLAHFNWHKNSQYESGVYNRLENINNINTLLNRRIERMFELCHKAKIIIFVVGEFQGYEKMIIDDRVFSTKNTSILSESVMSKFGAKAKVLNFDEVSSYLKLSFVLDNSIIK